VDTVKDKLARARRILRQAGSLVILCTCRRYFVRPGTVCQQCQDAAKTRIDTRLVA
jgi:hypothetical protein